MCPETPPIPFEEPSDADKRVTYAAIELIMRSSDDQKRQIQILQELVAAAQKKLQVLQNSPAPVNESFSQLEARTEKSNREIAMAGLADLLTKENWNNRQILPQEQVPFTEIEDSIAKARQEGLELPTTFAIEVNGNLKGVRAEKLESADPSAFGILYRLYTDEGTPTSLVLKIPVSFDVNPNFNSLGAFNRTERAAYRFLPQLLSPEMSKLMPAHLLLSPLTPDSSSQGYSISDQRGEPIHFVTGIIMEYFPHTYGQKKEAQNESLNKTRPETQVHDVRAFNGLNLYTLTPMAQELLPVLQFHWEAADSDFVITDRKVNDIRVKSFQDLPKVIDFSFVPNEPNRALAVQTFEKIAHLLITQYETSAAPKLVDLNLPLLIVLGERVGALSADDLSTQRFYKFMTLIKARGVIDRVPLTNNEKNSHYQSGTLTDALAGELASFSSPKGGFDFAVSNMEGLMQNEKIRALVVQIPISETTRRFLLDGISTLTYQEFMGTLDTINLEELLAILIKGLTQEEPITAVENQASGEVIKLTRLDSDKGNIGISRTLDRISQESGIVMEFSPEAFPLSVLDQLQGTQVEQLLTAVMGDPFDMYWLYEGRSVFSQDLTRYADVTMKDLKAEYLPFFIASFEALKNKLPGGAQGFRFSEEEPFTRDQNRLLNKLWQDYLNSN